MVGHLASLVGSTGPVLGLAPEWESKAEAAMREKRKAALTQFEEYMSQYEAEFTEGTDWDADKCPPSLVDVEEIDHPVRMSPRPPIITDDDFAIHLPPAHDGLVFKTVMPFSRNEHVWNEFKSEKAIQRVLQDNTDREVPRMYTLNPQRTGADMLNRACRSWSIAMEFVGGNPARKLTAKNDHAAVTIGLLIARAIQILKFVHELGIVHGDIHGGNFVYSDPDDIPGTLRLIDFGRSRFVIDETGRFIGAPPSPIGEWNEELLSPWELDGEPTSFRDDLFRLAELGVSLEKDGGVIDLTNARRQWDRIPRSQKLEENLHGCPKYLHLVSMAKKARQFTHDSPIIDFYRATLKIPFAGEFDYDGWAARLSAAPASITD